MDTSAAFCFRHTLYPVYAAFVFKLGISSLSAYHEADIFHAADADFFHVHGFHFPALTFCIAHIHTVHFRCKKRCFVSACACTDFHDNVFIIVRVFGQQQDFHFLLQLFHTFSCLRQFFFQHLTHIFIAFRFQHSQTVLNILSAFFIFFVCLHNRGQITLFFHQRAEPLLIICHSGLMQLAHDFFVSDKQIFQFIKHFSPCSFQQSKQSIPVPQRVWNLKFCSLSFKTPFRHCTQSFPAKTKFPIQPGRDRQNPLRSVPRKILPPAS